MPQFAVRLVYVLVIAMIAFCLGIGYKLYQQAPKANIYVHPTGLSQSQYHILNTKMQTKQPSIGSFFKANLQVIRDDVTDFSWVDEVSVKRDWRRGIVIKAIPRQAVARFGSERLVDAEGKVFVPANESSLTVKPYTTLQGDSDQAATIMLQLQHVNTLFQPLNMQVEDMILTSRQTWLIKFNTGMRVVVDGENTAQKIMNVSNVLQSQLADKVSDIQVIDARYKNGFSITWH